MKNVKNQEIVFDLSTEGLDPFKHRIVGVTTKTDKEEKIFTYRDEERILREFWTYLKTNQFGKIIGFNSDKFDVPFLITRSLRHKVPMINLKGKSLDLRRLISFSEKQKGKLSDFKHLLEISFEEDRYGKMHISLLWQDKDIKGLRESLLQDVKITWQLYLRLKGVGLID